MSHCKEVTISVLVHRLERGHYRIALGEKLSKICRNRLAFPGGRVEASDRSLRSAALREIEEEVGVSEHALCYFKRLGIVRFFNGGGRRRKRPDFFAHIFWAEVSVVVPLRGSDEIRRPRWFDLRRVPWERMMVGDHIWFRQLLASRLDGTRFLADILRNRKKTRLEHFSVRRL